MSSEIYYEKAFISIGDRFIPLVCRGSTNTFEFNVHGCEVAERYWSVLDLPYRGRLLFTSDEIQKIAEKVCGEIRNQSTVGTALLKLVSFSAGSSRA